MLKSTMDITMGFITQAKFGPNIGFNPKNSEPKSAQGSKDFLTNCGLGAHSIPVWLVSMKKKI